MALQISDFIRLNPTQKGLLSLDEDHLKKLINTNPISNDYIVEQTPFARGKFAAVRKCINKITGVSYAAKFIRKRRRVLDHRADNIYHEIAVLEMSQTSPKIVSLHQVYETITELILVLELASGGELQRVLDVQDGLKEEEVRHVLKQILNGLLFLHDNNIAHLDIKPQNILLTSDYPCTDIKLCDFGISRIIHKGVEVKEIIGTPDYVAPEVLSFEPISLGTDIWSVGVLTYVLLTGYSPFTGDNKQETFCNISQCNLSFPEDYFSKISEEAINFITSTLVINPEERLTVRECLEHPWLCQQPIQLPAELSCCDLLSRVSSSSTSFTPTCIKCPHCCRKSGNSVSDHLNMKLIEANSRYSQVDRSIIC